MSKSSSLLGLLCGLVAGAAQAQSLQEAVESALQHHPQMKIAQAERQQAEQGIAISGSAYLPKIDVKGSMGYEYTQNVFPLMTGSEVTGWSRNSSAQTRHFIEVQAEQNLFDGFKNKNAYLQSVSQARAAGYSYLMHVDQMALDVVDAYLSVYAALRKVEFAKENLDAHNQVYAHIEKRSDAGASKGVDLEQAKGRVALSRTSLLSAQAELVQAESQFMQLTGTMPVDIMRPEIKATDLPDHEAQALAQALKTHPMIEQAKMAYMAAKAAMKSQEMIYMPKVDALVQAQVGRNDDGQIGQKNFIGASVRATMNVFNGGADKARREQAAQGLMIAKERRAMAQRQIEQSMRQAWSQAMTLRSQLRYYEQHQQSAQQVKQAYAKQFAAAERSLLDRLHAESEYFEARSRFIEAQVRALSGEYRLMQICGRLLDTLGISLEHPVSKEPANLRALMEPSS